MVSSRRDAEAELNLPPGFRFHPTDEELVVDYLVRKASGQRLPVPIIAEVDIYKFDPWDLPELALFGKKEWYFFTPRDRKYQNGSRPNRAAGRGYWKATGADKPVVPPGSGRAVGIKKSLVFYHGKAPKGVKTDWIMHEYRLADVDRSAGSKNGSLRLDDCVLCRLYNKKNSWEKMQQKKKQLLPAATSAKVSVSMETTDDTRSESVWTPNSEIEQENNPTWPSQGVEQGKNDCSEICSFRTAEELKEEGSDWFTDLNLDDFLQSYSWPATAFDLSNQDYFDLAQNQSNYLPPSVWN